ncbi:MAG: Lrp/AsnC family transcriptional regulator [Pseudomonadota bacterium]
MDVIDQKVLRMLQSHPTASMTDLAAMVSMSHTACWKRVKRLERDGYIAGRAVLLNQRAVGLNITAMVEIKIEKHTAEKLDVFESSVDDIPEIIACYSMSGDSDYILHVVAKSIEDYEQFLKGKLSRLPHVESIKSNFALKLVKNTTDLPV